MFLQTSTKYQMFTVYKENNLIYLEDFFNFMLIKILKLQNKNQNRLNIDKIIY